MGSEVLALDRIAGPAKKLKGLNSAGVALRAGTRDFWLSYPNNFKTIPDLYHYLRVVIVLGIVVVAFLLALAPLVVMRGPTPRFRSLGYLSYFLCLGAGFMCLEIGLIQRASMLFGNPGLTIAIVLCSIILFTGLGSLISNRSYARGLSFRVNAAAVAAYALAAGFALPWIIDGIIGWSLAAKTLILFLIVAPGAILMGHMFPQGIALAAREDKALVPWAWAINGAMSASVAGIAPLVAQALGFQSLFMIGAGLYLMILLIPVFATADHPGRIQAIAE